MTLERMPGPQGPEPAPPGIGDAGSGSPVALRLQVLSTEHWGLLATRSMAWTESFTRAGMFLSALSGAIVALALIGQGTAFGEEFVLFALLILPVVLFIGIGTFIRMGTANYNDAVCVVGMNRIRHAYLQIAPEVEPYLVFGATDDEAGINASMGMRPGQNFIVYILASSPFMLAAIDAVLGGVIAVIVAHQLGVEGGAAVAIGIVAALLVIGLLMLYALRDISSAVRSYEPRFPAAKTE